MRLLSLDFTWLAATAMIGSIVRTHRSRLSPEHQGIEDHAKYHCDDHQHLHRLLAATFWNLQAERILNLKPEAKT